MGGGKEKDLGSMARAALNKRNGGKKRKITSSHNNTPPETNKEKEGTLAQGLLVRLRRVQLDGTLHCKCALASVLRWSVWVHAHMPEG